MKSSASTRNKAKLEHVNSCFWKRRSMRLMPDLHVGLSSIRLRLYCWQLPLLMAPKIAAANVFNLEGCIRKCLDSFWVRDVLFILNLFFLKILRILTENLLPNYPFKKVTGSMDPILKQLYFDLVFNVLPSIKEMKFIYTSKDKSIF